MSETLSKEETAYFESRGEAAIPAPEKDPVATPEAPAEGAGAAGATPAAAAPEKAQEPEKYVPLSALHEERTKRREIADKLRLIEGQLQGLLAGKQPAPEAKPADPAVPEFGQDPEGFVKAKFGVTAKEISDLKAWKDAQDAQAQQRAQMDQIANLSRAHEVEFQRETPDYAAASEFLRERRTAELRALGMPEHQIIPALTQDVLGIAIHAVRNNGNFAKMIYDTAKARGYTKAEDKPAEKAAPAATPAPNLVEQADRIARGQAKAAGIGGAGAAPPTKMTPQRLLEMSPAQFAKWEHENPEEYRALMGG